MTTEPFTVTAEIAYRPFRIPPRCRNARPVPESFNHHIDIPSVTSEDAPVVAIVPDDHGQLGSARGGEVPMRCFDGRLFVALTDGASPVVAGSKGFPAKVMHTSYEHGSFEAMTEAEKSFNGILIIDGQVWKEAEEPRYTIMTMGLAIPGRQRLTPTEMPPPTNPLPGSTSKPEDHQVCTALTGIRSAGTLRTGPFDPETDASARLSAKTSASDL